MIIKNIGLLSLPGNIGANPELVGFYPLLDLREDELRELLDKSLPMGIEPNTFYSTRFKNTLMFAYVFTSKPENSNERGDLVSIIVMIKDKKVRIKDFEMLFKIIIEKMIEQDISTRVLKESLNEIYMGINSKKKIKIKDVTIDPSEIIKKHKLSILKEKENLEGRIL